MSESNSVREIEHWLTRASGLPPAEEIQAIRRHLQSLVSASLPAVQRQRLTDGLHARTCGVIDALMPRLFNVRLPISNNTRQTVRSMQEALESLARLGFDIVETSVRQPVTLATPVEISLSQIIEALGRHVVLANLIAAPVGPGIWFNLHRAYLTIRLHRAEKLVPPGARTDLQTAYARTLIAGSLPSSALTANEWAFLHRFLADSCPPLAVIDSVGAGATEAALWIAPEQDMTPVIVDRRPPADGTLALYVPYGQLLAEIKHALSALVQGNQSPAFLPADTSARTARIALRRLRDHLSSPRKRRFPRRRQGYRASLCVGFEDICLLLKTRTTTSELTSEWMIVNESPGGYAAMHVSGRPSKAQVGDLVAMRREGENHWSISVVRWALSENPEHLEFGLEELSPRAISGHMATPGHLQDGHLLALLLPALPPLRQEDALAFSPASRPAKEKLHVFVSDGEKAEVREFRLGKPIEQSSGIDVFLIAPLDTP